MGSIAVGLERISRIVGYMIAKGDFSTVTPYLPQRIAILGEANTANQATFPTEPTQITSSQQAGELFGYGSVIHSMARILLPVSGDGVGGIPVVVYPQAAAVGAAEKKLTVTPAGIANGNGTHTLVIAGRTGLDSVFYDINIQDGDDAADIAQKMADAINNVLGAPVAAIADDYKTTLTAKWKGLTSQEITVSVFTGDDDLGITYAVNQTQAGSGTPSIADALTAFGSTWNTIVLNSYGTLDSIMDALENFNGIPLAIPTGRYAGIIMKPFIAITGSVANDPTAITDPRSEDVTIAIAPAPFSLGFHWEAAANMARLYAVVAQNQPHLDVAGQDYPDMPTPTSIGMMAEYNNRDAFVKKGCSTVDLVAGRYRVQDFVTTYHPAGENPPQFRYCRNLNIDFNVRYGYYLKEQINVVDHSIAKDTDVVTVEKVVKPKQWIQILNTYADELTALSLIVDPEFMQKSLQVGIGVTNPDRLETVFKYKRSGYARISSTTAQAGFNFGTLN